MFTSQLQYIGGYLCGLGVTLFLLAIGWLGVWSVILVKIPIVREVCGIDEKKPVVFPPMEKPPVYQKKKKIE